MAGEGLLNGKLVSLLPGCIRDALKDFPGYAKIRRVSAYFEPWAIDNELTPTLKIKRAKFIEHNFDAIEQMYSAGLALGNRR